MFGFFIQNRIGINGKFFYIIKFRTHNKINQVTKFGSFLITTKLNELPQLFNVIIGNMSFVGPRPDVKGFADRLEGDDIVILSVKPGITGPSSLKYINEKEIILNTKLSEEEIVKQIWEDKVLINKRYVKNRNIFLDMKYIFKTFLVLFKK